MAVEVMREIGKRFGVIINRSEDKYDGIIEKYCAREGIDILLKIPFAKEIAYLYSKGIPFVEELTEWKPRFQKVYKEIEGLVR